MEYVRMSCTLFLAAGVLVSLNGCGIWEEWGTADAGPKPVTAEVLALMPEGSGAAFGIPPIDAMTGKIFAVFERIAPEDVPAKDVAGAFARFVGHLLNVPEAETIGDVFSAHGIAPDAPMGIYLWPGEPLGMAAVFTVTDPNLMDGLFDALRPFLAENLDVDKEITKVEPDGVRRFPGNLGAYVVTADNRAVLGSADGFVRQVLARMDNPAPVRYGTVECPAESTSEFVALVRMDRMPSLGRDLVRALSGETGLTNVIETENPEVFGPDPMVIALDWTAEDARFLMRLDLAEHEALRRRLGRPHPLRLARSAPENTLGLISLRFNPESKEYMLGMFGGLMAGAAGVNDGYEFEVGETMGQWAQLVDDELTLAMTGMEDGRPTGVGMLAVSNRDTLSRIAMSLPVPGEPVETYRRVEIRRMPQSTLYYATARNTLVIGDRLDEVRESIGHLLSGGGRVFEAFNPDIDSRTRRYGAVFLQGDAVPAVTEAVLSFGPEVFWWLSGPRHPVRDLRITLNLQGTWLEARTQIRFRERDGEQAAP